MRLAAYIASGIASSIAPAVIALSVLAANAAAAPGDYRIMLSNRCSIPVNVAVRTRQSDGQWRTMGWQVVQPGAVKINSLFTQNRIFYLYARTSDQRYRWSGQDRPGSVRRPIVSTSFRHSTGPLDGPGYSEVLFRKLVMPEGQSVYTFRFQCK
jgi:uncharacterized membrane protein